MDFANFVSTWRNSTYQFSTNSLWYLRLGKLKIFSQKDLKLYWESLQKTPNHSATMLSTLLNGTTELETDNKHSFIERKIAKELCDFTCTTILNLGVFSHLVETARREILNILLTQLESITNSTLEFEHKVFLATFPKENPSYSYFVNQITCKEEWLEYTVQSYPILCRELVLFQNNYKSCFSEFCTRLKLDLPGIQHRFKIPTELLYINSLRPFCGDVHREGRSTILISLSTDTGEQFKFFYKPKPLATDVAFYSILQKIWELGLKKTIIPTINWNRGPYGWQKYEDAYTEVDSSKQLKTYCFNQGVNTAIAYFLGVQDLIADNILVKKEFPMFFDLEMLFSPTTKDAGDYLTCSKIAKHYLNGVIRTGLIPCFGFESLHQTGSNNSGLSLNSKKENAPNFHSFPFYTQELLAGFDYACRFVKEHSQEIIKTIKEEIANCSNLQTRYLVRFTFNYAQVFKALYSPLCQEKATQQHFTLEKLWIGYRKNILEENIIQDEIRQILQGDIPIFTTHPSSRDLYDEKGILLIRNYFKYDGLTASIQRIEGFSEEEQLIQKEIVKRAFYIHNGATTIYKHPLGYNTSRQRKTDLLSQIASFLYSLPQGVKDPKYFTYIDYTISKDDMWDQGIQHSDIFQGIAGVGIFFMAWYRYSKDTRAIKIIHKIYNQSIEYLHNNRNSLLDSPIVKLGVMGFPSSILYYYIISYKILKEEGPILSDDDLFVILDYIERKYQYDTHFDYFSGSTGLILILMELFKIKPSKRLHNIILLLGDHLVLSATTIDSEKIAWKKKSFSLWGGFAHGNSSAAYALFRLWSFSGNIKFHKVAIQALNYDQALFVADNQYWKKSLDTCGEIHHSWGNGTAGIGLSRNLISPYYKNLFMEQELHIAKGIIRREITNRTYTDHSIASGLLGLLEVFQLLDKRFSAKQCLRLEFENTDLSNIRCGGWSENPALSGLYYGYAGIGYNLIKLQYIPELPSLLWI